MFHKLLHKDPVIRSFYIGMAAVFFKDIFDVIYMGLGYQGVLMIEVAAGTFVNADATSTTAGLIIGTVAHYTLGGLLGILFMILLSSIKKIHALEKGIFFGLAVWLFLAGGLLTLGISRYAPVDPSVKIMLLLDHIIFGLILGFLIPRYT